MIKIVPHRAYLTLILLLISHPLLTLLTLFIHFFDPSYLDKLNLSRQIVADPIEIILLVGPLELMVTLL